MRVPRLHWLGPVGTHDEGVDGTGATLMKIGALFFCCRHIRRSCALEAVYLCQPR
jgi:hypothetical protein